MKKIILSIVLALIVVSGFSQTNAMIKGIVSYNVDSTTFKSTVASTQAQYGSVGALYWNKQSEKWRIYIDSVWYDLTKIGGGGGTLDSIRLLGDVTGFGADSITTSYNTVVPVIKGGTGLSAQGSALQQLRVNSGATAYEHFTPLFNPSTTNGDLIYFNGTTYSRLGIGTSGQVLTNNGTTPSWGVGTSQVAGSNTQIQYNNSGAFGAESAFTYNPAGDSLTISGSGFSNVSKTFGNVWWNNSGDQWVSISSASAEPNLQFSGGFTLTNFNDDDDGTLTIQNTESDINIWAGEGAGGDISILATNGDIRLANSSGGNIILETGTIAGSTIKINSGTNEQAGGATLVAGTATVNNVKINVNNTIVMYNRVTAGGTLGHLSYTLAPGSVTFTSTSATETSTIAFWLFDIN